jgi:hypothetical protein
MVACLINDELQWIGKEEMALTRYYPGTTTKKLRENHEKTQRG